MSPVVHLDLVILESLDHTICQKSQTIETSFLTKTSSVVLTEGSTSRILKGCLHLAKKCPRLLPGISMADIRQSMEMSRMIPSSE